MEVYPVCYLFNDDDDVIFFFLLLLVGLKALLFLREKKSNRFLFKLNLLFCFTVRHMHFPL